ncbi:MAG: uracil-DNA glycosylase [Candidatus Contendobacter sp.]
MDNKLRRRYLAALDIPLWVARQPVTAPMQPAPVLPDSPLSAAEGPGVRAAIEQASVPSPNDDWMPPMDDAWEPMTETGAETLLVAPSSVTSRVARIVRLDWGPLAEEVRQCTACGLCSSRTQTVFGVGDRRADWLIVGEAPGADEDRQGEPFVGRAGKLLNPMLQAVGLQREQVYIANILKCRPPENRDPAPTEAASCRPFLERQIALIQPRILLAVGRIAAQNLLGTDAQIGKLRGQVHHFGPTGIPLVVTYHPAYLLRSPREKRKAWDDLRLARRALGSAPARS